VRMAAEAGDDVAVSAGLIRGELEDVAKLLRGLSREFLCEFNRPFLIRKILGMSEWQEKESFFPRCFERCVVAVLDPFDDKAESLRILREGFSRSTVNRARELIQNDDKCEPRPWVLRPAIELASRGSLQQWREALDYLRVRAAAKPPLHLANHLGVIATRQAVKPELQNLFELFICQWRVSLYRSTWFLDTCSSIVSIKFYKSSGLSPVRFAIRAGIRGPSSSSA
jgi:hypothetical protein